MFTLPLLRAAYGPFTAKVTLAPLALAFAQALFWFRFYRFGGRLAKLGAAIFSVVFVLVLLAHWVGQAVSSEPGGASVAFYIYLLVSHVAYASIRPRTAA